MSYLWYMHSEVLEGFYASEVYVTAENQALAIDIALYAYDLWLAHYIEQYYYDPLTGGDPEDEDYKNEALEKKLEFKRELQRKLVRIPTNGVIFRKS